MSSNALLLECASNQDAVSKVKLLDMLQHSTASIASMGSPDINNLLLLLMLLHTLCYSTRFCNAG